jgi:hypothetical protein
VIWYVFSQQVNKFCDRMPQFDSPLQFQVFFPELYLLTRNLRDPVLRDWWVPYISTCISQEVFFGL